MTILNYRVETDGYQFCVVGPAGLMASFNLVEDAIRTMRNLESKTFPGHWSKVPPATRHAQQRYYGADHH